MMFVAKKFAAQKFAVRHSALRVGAVALTILLMLMFLSGCQQTLTYGVNDLLPELQARVVQSQPYTFDETGMANVRAATDAIVGSADLPTDPAVRVYNILINTPSPASGGASAQLRLRIYEPASKSTTRANSLPGVLWLHGGGMVSLRPESFEARSIDLVKQLNCVVVAPDYRLAPEYPHPAAPDDCYTALQWLTNNAGELGVNPAKIAVAGDSAGGGLALSIALRARDEGGPKIAFVVALYPMINEKLDTPSGQASYVGLPLTSEFAQRMWGYYLNDIPADAVSKYAAPKHETDWSRLPPVYTMCGNIDPFYDDVVWLAKQLKAAGNPVQSQFYSGCYHAFDCFDPFAGVSINATNELHNALAAAFK